MKAGKEQFDHEVKYTVAGSKHTLRLTGTEICSSKRAKNGVLADLGGVCPSFTDEIPNVLFGDLPNHLESRQNIQRNDLRRVQLYV